MRSTKMESYLMTGVDGAISQHTYIFFSNAKEHGAHGKSRS